MLPLILYSHTPSFPKVHCEGHTGRGTGQGKVHLADSVNISHLYEAALLAVLSS